MFLNELMGEGVVRVGGGGEVPQGPMQLLRATTRRRREPQTPEVKLFKGIWWLRTFLTRDCVEACVRVRKKWEARVGRKESRGKRRRWKRRLERRPS